MSPGSESGCPCSKKGYGTFQGTVTGCFFRSRAPAWERTSPSKMVSVARVAVQWLVSAVMAGLFMVHTCLADDWKVASLISREIVPYITMVEGVETKLRIPLHRFFFDDAGVPYSLSGGASDLLTDYDVLIAVGPEALAWADRHGAAGHTVYAMVLNPHHVVRDISRFPCGVSLNIPPDEQLAGIMDNVPHLKKLGVLFDPANNQEWFDRARQAARAMGVELVPLVIETGGPALDLPGKLSGLDGILFIPDRSVISKAVISHVIKSGILQGVPVVGYNRFFHESGAALSFIIDYRKTGEQVAEMVLHFLQHRECRTAVPAYTLSRQENVWRLLQDRKP